MEVDHCWWCFLPGQSIVGLGGDGEVLSGVGVIKRAEVITVANRLGALSAVPDQKIGQVSSARETVILARKLQPLYFPREDEQI
ncbi:hypothetical protein [Actinosynnema sp. NPDC023587]|uniref:hypothetical protein n=1 Tax=Actinosynnema sp. NPDC023587 TaxID=3154695 RepID=UPI0034013740